jgi:hypothetical protein
MCPLDRRLGVPQIVPNSSPGRITGNHNRGFILFYSCRPIDNILPVEETINYLNFFSLKMVDDVKYRWAVPWLRRLVAGLSPRRPEFDPRSSPCEICGGQSGTGTGFSLRVVGFALSISFHWCSINCKTW